MLTGDAVEYDLEDFYVDDDKSGIDKKVHHGHQRVAEHFLLTEGKEQKIFPALGRVIAEVLRTSEMDITGNLTGLFGKQKNCHCAEEDEK